MNTEMSTSKKPIWPIALCLLSAVALISLALATLRFPIFFTQSTAVIGGGFTFVLALSFLLMLPDRFLYSDAQLLAYHFQQRHGLSDGRAETVLDAIQSAHAKATALRGYSQNVHSTLKADLNHAADRLDAITGQLLEAPADLRQVQALVVRSDLLVEAAATHADLRQKASEGMIAESREKVQAGLAAFQHSFDEMEDGAAQRLMHRVSVSTDTAELLLGRRSK